MRSPWPLLLALAALAPLAAPDGGEGREGAAGEPAAETVADEPGGAAGASSAARPGHRVLPAPPARVRVLTGHAALVRSGGPTLLTRRSPAAQAGGPGFLHVAPGARAEIRRSGEASLRVEGPAELEWDPPSAAGAGGVWRVLSAAGLDVEVRRGTERLELLGAGWTLRARDGAFHLATQPGGAIAVTHHAGAPLVAEPAPGRVRPPGGSRGLAPGQKALLPVLAALAGPGPVPGR